MRNVIRFSFAALSLVALTAVAGTASAEDRVVVVKTKVVKREEPVGTTHTTSAYVEPAPGRDIIGSRADERRIEEGKHWTLAPMLGGGTNGLGFGIGARLGYTFNTPVYVGGNFMYHATDGASTYAYYPSAEIGYDIGVDSVLLRPYGGVGALVSGDRFGNGSTGLVYPGFTVHYLVPRSPAFVGGDARVLLPFEGSAAFSAFATTGLNF